MLRNILGPHIARTKNAASSVEVPPPPPHASAPAAWLSDPRGRHEFRYWDGEAWTDNVSDAGHTSTDPVIA
jgi:hypothetical protein